MAIGLIGAMPQEIELIKHHMTVTHEFDIAKRAYYLGTLHGQDIVLVGSRIGKVSAAVTTAMMLEHFDIDRIIFTGVAGAVSSALNVGDMVVSDNLFQHDMNATPLFLQYEIPLLDKTFFEADMPLAAQVFDAASTFVNTRLCDVLEINILQQFSITTPTVYRGSIASGDQFVKDPQTVKAIEAGARALNLTLPCCVEMEGAACAQVCYEFNMPFVVVRTISDKADHSAPVDFGAFINKVASHFSYEVISALLLRDRNNNITGVST